MKSPRGPRGPERIRPGLERIRAAFGMTGHPERSFRSVHIAGTNGKGSTACFAEAILRRILPGPVGLFTSPHLLSPEERIRVGGAKIAPASFVRSASLAEALSRNVAAAAGEPLSYFEVMTWIACDWFRRRKVSVAVMEVGLGGRWDATNLCLPEVSVITNVGIDHAEWLGGTLGKIAAEKAGILRDDTPAVLGVLPPSARRAVMAVIRERKCPVWETGREIRRDGRNPAVFHLPGITIPRVRVGMEGEFQVDNALLACASAWIVAGNRGVGSGEFARAARSAIADAKLPGRFSRLPGRRNAGAWVDGAHNPAAARALSRELSLRRKGGGAKRIVALWSMLADKDIAGFLRAIAPSVDGIVAYPMECDRAAPMEVLSAAMKKAGVPHRKAVHFPDGWEIAREWAGNDGMVIVCGSLMAAADAYRLRVGEVA